MTFFVISANGVKISHGKSKHKDVEKMYKKWLKDYKSPNPKHQDYCANILATKSGSSSQYSQDLFIFFNFFKYWPMEHRTGFYIDSGTNDAIQLSNTYFFDVCLGWSGLCIEPEIQYHASIRENRTCHLIPECVSDVNQKVGIIHAGVLSSITSQPGDTKCSTLSDMLARVNKNTNIAPNHTVDFWSLDVEGYEMTVLRSVNFEQIHFRVLLVEEFWQVTRSLDRLLNERGYNKYHQLPIDAVYTHRSVHTPVHPWYEATYEETWKGLDSYRQLKKDNISCI